MTACPTKRTHRDRDNLHAIPDGPICTCMTDTWPCKRHTALPRIEAVRALRGRQEAWVASTGRKQLG
jgi:hypothetical protein